MNEQKQFVGFLSSTSNPGQLSLTVASLTKALISAGALYAAIHGLDSSAVTTQLQNLIDTVVTGVAAAMTLYHTVMLVYGIVHKALHALVAKPVVTIPTAVPTAVTTDGKSV